MGKQIDLDAAKAALDALPDVSVPSDADVDALKAQIADLQKKNDDLVAAKASEDLDLVALQDKLSKDEDALKQVKALVDALLVPQS